MSTTDTPRGAEVCDFLLKNENALLESAAPKCGKGKWGKWNGRL